jgi:serine/threonine protein kinase
VSESRPVHTTFREAVQQLAEASEKFQLDGVDFLRALLQVDPANRLTAQQALEHPFLTKAFLSVAIDSMPPAIKKPVIPETTLDRQLRDACRKLIQKRMG